MGPPSPTGIAAYGIYNNSGTISTVRGRDDSVVGFADVSQLSALDNGTNTCAGVPAGEHVLQVNNTDGSSFTYWPQNVLAFDTASPSTVTYRDNVLNVTGDNAQLTNQSITGVGTVGGIHTTAAFRRPTTGTTTRTTPTRTRCPRPGCST